MSRKRAPGRPAGKESGAVNRFRPHPWHGLEVGPDPPEVLNAYIEITPFDLMKYEVDKIGRVHALNVVRATMTDYEETFAPLV